MLKNLLKDKTRTATTLFLILLLIAIRVFESNLFYDPFLVYFKNEFTNSPYPNISILKLFFSYGFRFYINSMISLALIYLIFKDTKIVKFSILLYMVFGSILMISFFFVLKFFGPESKMILFYIRRFIIQPIFVMLFIPAFYYQKRMK